MEHSNNKKTSPWVYVGLGCLGAIVLGVAALATLGWYGYRKGKQLEADMKDPEARARRVRDVLGADRLPEGYHAVVGLSVPFAMEMALLSDREPKEGDESLGKRGFIYINFPAVGTDHAELRDYFEGKTDDPAVLRKNKIHLRQREIIKRGSLPMDGFTALYLAQRGEVDFGEDRAEGVTSVILIECPGSSSPGGLGSLTRRMRMGIWFGPEAADRSDLTGTPADEVAMRGFLSHFRPCHG